MTYGEVSAPLFLTELCPHSATNWWFLLESLVTVMAAECSLRLPLLPIPWLTSVRKVPCNPCIYPPVVFWPNPAGLHSTWLAQSVRYGEWELLPAPSVSLRQVCLSTALPGDEMFHFCAFPTQTTLEGTSRFSKVLGPFSKRWFLENKICLWLKACITASKPSQDKVGHTLL